jgi:hypothetical protein
MRMMLLISVLILFTFCEKNIKKSNKMKTKGEVSSFLQVTMRDAPKIYDDVALDDKYEKPDTSRRIQEDYMGDGKSEEELFEEFKQNLQKPRPTFQFR